MPIWMERGRGQEVVWHLLQWLVLTSRERQRPDFEWLSTDALTVPISWHRWGTGSLYLFEFQCCCHKFSHSFPLQIFFWQVSCLCEGGRESESESSPRSLREDSGLRTWGAGEAKWAIRRHIPAVIFSLSTLIIVKHSITSATLDLPVTREMWSEDTSRPRPIIIKYTNMRWQDKASLMGFSSRLVCQLKSC